MVHKTELSAEDKAKISRADDSVLLPEEFDTPWGIDAKTGEAYPVRIGRNEYNRRLKEALRATKRNPYRSK